MTRRYLPLALGIAFALGSSPALADDAAASDAATTDAGGAPASAGARSHAATTDAGAAPASAEARSAVGVDVGALVPLGNLGDDTGVMLGGLVKFGYGVTHAVGITARAGYLYGFDKTTTVAGASVKYGLADVPIWVGARYFTSGKCQGFHLGGELGLNVLMARSKLGGRSDSATRAKVGLNVLPGYKVGDIDIQAQLSSLDIGHPVDTVALGVTIGYDFAKF